MGIDGKLHITSWDTAFDSLPSQVQNVFSKEERQVYENGASEILCRMRASNEENIVEAALCFRQDQAMHVYIESFFDRPVIWFGLSSIKLRHQIRVCLPSAEQNDLTVKLPDRMYALFSVIGGVSIEDPNFPKLCRPDFVDSKQLAEESDNCSTSNSPVIAFLRYSTGDFVCCDSEANVLLYDFHEQHFRAVDLDSVLDSFLEEVCEPRAWGIK